MVTEANVKPGMTIQSISLSGDPHIDSLLFGSSWRLGVDGSISTTITYSFPGLQSLWPDYAPGLEPNVGLAPLSTAIERQAVRDALLAWGSVANFQFQEVADNADGFGTLRIAYTTLAMGTGQLAYAYAPADVANGGDVWLNGQLRESLYSSFTPGALSSYVLLHELGHALGLKHPHAASMLNGTTLGSLEDSLFNSAMSYYAWPGIALTQTNIDRLPSTPMARDIDAMQVLYGANTSFANGDNLYTFDGSGKYLETIYDTGGNDTIRVTGSRPAKIDLRADQWSKLGIPVQISVGAIQSTDTVRIYKTTQIENAIGGDGNDTLIGNDAGNRLVGGNGNDTLIGYLGSDMLEGGPGADSFVLDVGSQDVIADFNPSEGDRLDLNHIFPLFYGYNQGGDAFATGHLALSQIDNDLLVWYDIDGNNAVGDAHTLVTLRNISNTSVANLNFIQGVDARPLALILNGSADSNEIVGSSDSDAINGGGGSDTISGHDGDDVITVGGNGGAAFTTLVDGGAGNDRLNIAYAGISGLADFSIGYDATGL
ncbi:MAG: M10 family metallopeptidase, partial [Burkholderiales bacterium]